MDMPFIEVMTGLAALLVFVWYWLRPRRKSYSPPVSTHMPPEDAQDFALVNSVFVNPAERAFYSCLLRAFRVGAASEALILTKVRLEDVIGVAPHVKDSKRIWQLRGRVKSRHIDYLVTAPNGRPLLAIELDGASHKHPQAAPGDALKEALFAACGLEFRRVVTGEDFSKTAASAAFFVANTIKSPQRYSLGSKKHVF